MDAPMTSSRCAGLLVVVTILVLSGGLVGSAVESEKRGEKNKDEAEESVDSKETPAVALAVRVA